MSDVKQHEGDCCESCLAEEANDGYYSLHGPWCCCRSKLTPEQATVSAEATWRAYVDACLANNLCPYSGEDGRLCKASVCDCFKFEDRWGVSQR